ncbi:MAG: SusE domain-containing protein [Mediterranea sp.]|jgi:hypothetical protein|nr:SusE domain-containing protein [Mediterranea sp.]
MKNKILKLGGAACCLLLALPGCNKDPEYYTLETPADIMLVQASANALTLEKAKEDEVAVTFSWNEASNLGTTANNLVYYFRMYMAEDATKVSKVDTLGGDTRSISFTHKELNDMLATWGMSTGDEVTIEAEVIAQLRSTEKYQKPELSKTTLNMFGYIKNVTAIYLVSVADDGTRSLVRMPEKVTGSAIYQTTTDLVPGKYFFALSQEKDYPAYVKGTTADNSLQYVADGEGTEMLDNALSGNYTVVVDLNQLDVNFVQLYPLPQGVVCIIGAACEIGWDTGKSSSEGQLTAKDPRHPELLSWTGQFYAGSQEFKLMLEGNYGGKFFFAPYQGAFPDEEHELGEARYQDNGGDLKWFVKADGRYTLTVNIDVSAMTIDLQPATE